MRLPYPPSCQMFFQFLLVKSQLFYKVNLVWFDLPFVFALRSQICHWNSPLALIQSPCFLVAPRPFLPSRFFAGHNPLLFRSKSNAFSSSVKFSPIVLRSTQKFCFFFCGATILFSGSHNPLPCFYPLVLGVCYCSWFRQCFGAEFSPWFLGQSAGRAETNPLVLDGIFMGLFIYVHQPRICIFFAGYLADWPW